MGIEGAPGYLLTAGDGNGHGKAAGVAGGFCLPAQRFGDHLPGHMVDGGLPDRLVQPGLCHPANPCAAGNAHLGRAGQQHHRGSHRQAGGHVHVIAAVLFNGAFRALGSSAAEQGSYLHHDTLGRAQSDGFRRSAGQQQTSGSGSRQRRTGDGGVAAAQQFLPAAHIVLKLRLFRL